MKTFALAILLSSAAYAQFCDPACISFGCTKECSLTEDSEAYVKAFFESHAFDCTNDEACFKECVKAAKKESIDPDICDLNEERED